jgi:hypothetical protein
MSGNAARPIPAATAFTTPSMDRERTTTRKGTSTFPLGPVRVNESELCRYPAASSDCRSCVCRLLLRHCRGRHESGMGYYYEISILNMKGFVGLLFLLLAMAANTKFGFA